MFRLAFVDVWVFHYPEFAKIASVKSVLYYSVKRTDSILTLEVKLDIFQDYCFNINIPIFQYFNYSIQNPIFSTKSLLRNSQNGLWLVQTVSRVCTTELLILTAAVCCYIHAMILCD